MNDIDILPRFIAVPLGCNTSHPSDSNPAVLLIAPESDGTHTIGSLQAMCSEVEMSERNDQHGVSVFEAIPGSFESNGRYLCHKDFAVKKFQRSAADRVFDLQDVRTPNWCRKSVHYLIKNVVDLDINPKSSTKYHQPALKGEGLAGRFSFADIYSFCRDRLRCVLQDLTVQHAHTSRAFQECIEISTRFYILADEFLCDLERAEHYDRKQNDKMLSNTLYQLTYAYHMSRLRIKQHKSMFGDDSTPNDVWKSPHEAEMLSYMLLNAIFGGDSLSMIDHMKRYVPDELRNHPRIVFVCAVNSAVMERNAIRYARLLERADFLTGCLMARYAFLLGWQGLTAFYKVILRPNSTSAKIDLITAIHVSGLETPSRLCRLLDYLADEIDSANPASMTSTIDENGLFEFSPRYPNLSVEVPVRQPNNLPRFPSKVLTTKLESLNVSRAILLDPPINDPRFHPQFPAIELPSRIRTQKTFNPPTTYSHKELKSSSVGSPLLERDGSRLGLESKNNKLAHSLNSCNNNISSGDEGKNALLNMKLQQLKAKLRSSPSSSVLPSITDKTLESNQIPLSAITEQHASKVASQNTSEVNYKDKNLLSVPTSKFVTIRAASPASSSSILLEPPTQSLSNKYDDSINELNKFSLKGSDGFLFCSPPPSMSVANTTSNNITTSNTTSHLIFKDELSLSNPPIVHQILNSKEVSSLSGIPTFNKHSSLTKPFTSQSTNIPSETLFSNSTDGAGEQVHLHPSSSTPVLKGESIINRQATFYDPYKHSHLLFEADPNVINESKNQSANEITITPSFLLKSTILPIPPTLTHEREQNQDNKHSSNVKNYDTGDNFSNLAYAARMNRLIANSNNDHQNLDGISCAPHRKRARTVGSSLNAIHNPYSLTNPINKKESIHQVGSSGVHSHHYQPSRSPMGHSRPLMLPNKILIEQLQSQQRQSLSSTASKNAESTTKNNKWLVPISSLFHPANSPSFDPPMYANSASLPQEQQRIVKRPAKKEISCFPYEEHQSGISSEVLSTNTTERCIKRLNEAVIEEQNVPSDKRGFFSWMFGF